MTYLQYACPNAPLFYNIDCGCEGLWQPCDSYGAVSEASADGPTYGALVILKKRCRSVRLFSVGNNPERNREGLFRANFFADAEDFIRNENLWTVCLKRLQ